MRILSGNEQSADLISIRRSVAGGGDQVLLTSSALARILERHAAGELSTPDLIDLANELEANDEVEYEEATTAAIAQTLFEIASPEINGELTVENSRRLRDALMRRTTTSAE